MKKVGVSSQSMVRGLPSLSHSIISSNNGLTDKKLSLLMITTLVKQFLVYIKTNLIKTDLKFKYNEKSIPCLQNVKDFQNNKNQFLNKYI